MNKYIILEPGDVKQEGDCVRYLATEPWALIKPSWIGQKILQKEVLTYARLIETPKPFSESIAASLATEILATQYYDRGAEMWKEDVKRLLIKRLSQPDLSDSKEYRHLVNENARLKHKMDVMFEKVNDHQVAQAEMPKDDLLQRINEFAFECLKVGNDKSSKIYMDMSAILNLMSELALRQRKQNDL